MAFTKPRAVGVQHGDYVFAEFDEGFWNERSFCVGKRDPSGVWRVWAEAQNAWDAERIAAAMAFYEAAGH